LQGSKQIKFKAMYVIKKFSKTDPVKNYFVGIMLGLRTYSADTNRAKQFKSRKEAINFRINYLSIADQIIKL